MHRFGWIKAKLNRNTLGLSIMAGSALGSFLLSAKTGKEEVHSLHPIFEVGAMKDNNELDSPRYNQMRAGGDDRHHRRAVRRKTLDDSFQKQHGLSDSHGGHWSSSDYFAKEDSDHRSEMRNRRLMRRKTLDESFNHPGLSDSHGGHWAKK